MSFLKLDTSSSKTMVSSNAIDINNLEHIYNVTLK